MKNAKHLTDKLSILWLILLNTLALPPVTSRISPSWIRARPSWFLNCSNRRLSPGSFLTFPPPTPPTTKTRNTCMHWIRQDFQTNLPTSNPQFPKNCITWSPHKDLLHSKINICTTDLQINTRRTLFIKSSIYTARQLWLNRFPIARTHTRLDLLLKATENGNTMLFMHGVWMVQAMGNYWERFQERFKGTSGTLKEQHWILFFLFLLLYQ